MGKTYTSTIQAKAWKEHTCLSCGGVYSYLLQRKVTGQGGNADVAQRRAEENVFKTLNREVDTHPCPTCGLVQPDMVGLPRAKRHLAVFWVALVAFAVLLILRAAYAVQANTLTVVIAAACAAVAAAHFLIDRANPNRDAEGNCRSAAERVSAGVVRHAPGRPGAPRAELANPTKSVIHTAAVTLLLVGVAAAAAPEAVRSARGWTANDDTWPPVAGPGDVVRVYMEDSIESIKGYWKGRPQATVTGPQGFALTADATTNENNWGNSISAKSSEKRSTSHPWVEVTIPSRPELAGQPAKVAIDLDVLYPHLTDSNSFNEDKKKMHRTVSVQLAGIGAGDEYNRLWWAATAGGMALLLMCGQVLRGSARNLQRSAGPARVYA